MSDSEALYHFPVLPFGIMKLYINIITNSYDEKNIYKDREKFPDLK